MLADARQHLFYSGLLFFYGSIGANCRLVFLHFKMADLLVKLSQHVVVLC